MKTLGLMIVLVLVSACGREVTTKRSAAIGSLAPISIEREASNESCENHEAGEVFLASDGYNTCQCDAQGQAACTLIAVLE